MAAKAAFFIGGGSRQELDPVYEIISKQMNRSDHVLIIPFANDENKYERWFDTVSIPFSRVGINNINLLSFQEDTETMIRQIQASQVLYFTGGLPDLLMERLEQKQLTAAIINFNGIVIGYSAGALAFCKDCIITKDDDYPETKVIQGLGIVDFSVEVHYKPIIDEELYNLSETREIMALPDGSAIHWNGSKVTPLNKIFTFYHRHKAELQ